MERGNGERRVANNEHTGACSTAHDTVVSVTVVDRYSHLESVGLTDSMR